MEVNLDSKNRQKMMEVPGNTKKIILNVSRDKCNDVLLELVNAEGKATSKPLNKYLPEIKLKEPINNLRFTMNNFSTRPIQIVVGFK
ncbi:MAG: hypothetical protein MI922_23930 [Bacteroidales bacterium]|nr:hypothetical protein [Bacteroidales bacterium]